MRHLAEWSARLLTVHTYTLISVMWLLLLLLLLQAAYHYHLCHLHYDVGRRPRHQCSMITRTPKQSYRHVCIHAGSAIDNRVTLTSEHFDLVYLVPFLSYSKLFV